jgi:hypothetical protein
MQNVNHFNNLHNIAHFYALPLSRLPALPILRQPRQGQLRSCGPDQTQGPGQIGKLLGGLAQYGGQA